MQSFVDVRRIGVDHSLPELPVFVGLGDTLVIFGMSDPAMCRPLPVLLAPLFHCVIHDLCSLN